MEFSTEKLTDDKRFASLMETILNELQLSERFYMANCLIQSLMSTSSSNEEEKKRFLLNPLDFPNFTDMDAVIRSNKLYGVERLENRLKSLEESSDVNKMMISEYLDQVLNSVNYINSLATSDVLEKYVELINMRLMDSSLKNEFGDRIITINDRLLANPFFLMKSSPASSVNDSTILLTSSKQQTPSVTSDEMKYEYSKPTLSSTKSNRYDFIKHNQQNGENDNGHLFQKNKNDYRLRHNCWNRPLNMNSIGSTASKLQSTTSNKSFISNKSSLLPKKRLNGTPTNKTLMGTQSLNRFGGKLGKMEVEYTFNSGMKDVPNWLKSHRLHKYTQFFSTLTYEEMLNLRDETMEEKNITKGARDKFVKLIKGLNKRQEALLYMEMHLRSGIMSILHALQMAKIFIHTPIRSWKLETRDEYKPLSHPKQGSFLIQPSHFHYLDECDEKSDSSLEKYLKEEKLFNWNPKDVSVGDLPGQFISLMACIFVYLAADKISSIIPFYHPRDQSSILQLMNDFTFFRSDDTKSTSNETVNIENKNIKRIVQCEQDQMFGVRHPLFQIPFVFICSYFPFYKDVQPLLQKPMCNNGVNRQTTILRSKAHLNNGVSKFNEDDSKNETNQQNHYFLRSFTSNLFSMENTSSTDPIDDDLVVVEDECLREYIKILDRCQKHEAFTCRQRALLREFYVTLRELSPNSATIFRSVPLRPLKPTQMNSLRPTKTLSNGNSSIMTDSLTESITSNPTNQMSSLALNTEDDEVDDNRHNVEDDDDETDGSDTSGSAKCHWTYSSNNNITNSINNNHHGNGYFHQMNNVNVPPNLDRHSKFDNHNNHSLNEINELGDGRKTMILPNNLNKMFTNYHANHPPHYHNSHNNFFDVPDTTIPPPIFKRSDNWDSGNEYNNISEPYQKLAFAGKAFAPIFSRLAAQNKQAQLDSVANHEREIDNIFQYNENPLKPDELILRRPGRFSRLQSSSYPSDLNKLVQDPDQVNHNYQQVEKQTEDMVNAVLESPLAQNGIF
ncbi:hypothetical protein SNEBB_010058 [Seison nebaliae]|nr:hypothetical protein SNEBB_010058 [Seison nebaliae]